MTRDFDKLISEAAPALPDIGPSRRLSRALLHERMRPGRRHQGRRQGLQLAWAAGLVLVLVTAGHVGQLGSDGFDVEMRTIETGNGLTLQSSRSVFRGDVVGIPADVPTTEVRNWLETVSARNGAVKAITGMAFNGNTPFWRIDIEENLDGRTIITESEPQGLSVPSAPLGRDKMAFIFEEWEAFLALVEGGQIPSQPYDQVSAEGIVFDVQSWTKDYPKWGRFTYYLGLPVTAAKHPRH